jgi:AraC-like DNA-binding protein
VTLIAPRAVAPDRGDSADEAPEEGPPVDCLGGSVETEMKDDTRSMPFGRHRVVATSDFEEAHAALESVLPPLRMHVHEHSAATQLDMALNAVRVGGLIVSCLRFGRGVHLAADEIKNFYVNVPVSGVARSRTGRQPPVVATPECGAVFLPDQPAEVDWSDGCTQLCLMFPRRAVRLELEAMIDRPVASPIEFAPAMNLTTEHGRSWIAALHLLERQSDCQNGVLEHPLATANIEKLLIESLLLAQPHNYTDTLAQPQPPSAPKAVRRAIELIQTRPEQPWTTATLAREAMVSARCLQEGFQRYTAVPPMRYLRDVRLHRVHADLLGADADFETVAHIARRWGFLYLGRFGASYREKFGQTPSDTLRGPGPHPHRSRSR